MGSMRYIMESGDKLLVLVCKYCTYVENTQPFNSLMEINTMFL